MNQLWIVAVGSKTENLLQRAVKARFSLLIKREPHRHRPSRKALFKNWRGRWGLLGLVSSLSIRGCERV